MHVLNMERQPRARFPCEFIRAVGHPPDVVIPYDRAIAAASSLGAQAAQKSSALNRGLARILHDLAGEAAEKPHRFLHRIFG